MPVERQGICLGNVLRGIKKKVEKLTLPKNRREMWRQKQQNMGNPS
jgi:hypothetical protein